MFKEFKEFIANGNVLDVAVAFILASAFSAIVKSLVDGILMPLVGALTAGIDFSKLTATVAGVTLEVGVFLNAVITFLIVAFVLFLILKAFKRPTKKD